MAGVKLHWVYLLNHVRYIKGGGDSLPPPWGKLETRSGGPFPVWAQDNDNVAAA